MTDVPGADERRLATGAARALAVVAVPAAALAGVVAGWAGAVSALIGLVFVLLLFGAAAASLAYAVSREVNPLGVLVGGAVARLLLYPALLLGLAQVPWVHRPSLALATAAAVAVTLAHELRLLSRTPRLFWVDAHAGRSETARGRDTELMNA